MSLSSKRFCIRCEELIPCPSKAAIVQLKSSCACSFPLFAHLECIKSFALQTKQSLSTKNCEHSINNYQGPSGYSNNSRTSSSDIGSPTRSFAKRYSEPYSSKSFTVSTLCFE